MARVAHTLDEVLSGAGRFVLLMGEPGIGKTRLCDEITTVAGERGVPVLWGRSWEAGGAPAYWPWVQAFRSLELPERVAVGMASPYRQVKTLSRTPRPI